MTPRSPLADAEARRLIREDLTATIVVEAAAGTGKTTELVERMVNVLATGATTVDRLVAVTFTEKAAGELKLRLRTELEVRRGAPDSSPGVRDALNHALARLEEAHVSTIHGFCAELLRERPVEAGVDPRFAMLTERAAERLYGEVFTRWLHEQLEQPGDGVRRALRRQRRGDWSGPSRPGQEDGPSTRLLRAGWQLLQWRDFPAPWARRHFARERQIDALLDALFVFAELVGRPASAQDGFYRSVRSAVQLADRVRHEEALTGQRDYEGLEAQLTALNTYAFRRPQRGSGSTYAKGVPRKAVHEAHAQLVPHLEEFVRHADADLAALVRDELAETVERYEAAKAAIGALDFLDLLLKARDLVRGHESVRQAFQSRFTHLFVDEFQDTDPVQAELLLLLAAADPAERDWRQVVPTPGKLFIVGDPKQSIYRFRRADVGVYQDVRDLLVAKGARGVELESSFRSVPGIQAFVNHAFSRVMTGDRERLQADYVPLAVTRPAASVCPAIVALPVPDPYANGRVQAKQIESSLADAAGAFVHWLLASSGWRVTERGAAQAVPVSARHVCILFRRFDSWGEDVTRPYLEALEARGVPHLLVGGKSFHDREEVDTLRTALTAIEWPDDELSVFGTLHGALFALPDDLLLDYRERHRRWHPFDVREDGSVELSPVREALVVLRDLHLGRNHRPVAETVSRLLDATRAHATFAFRKAGEQALANVLYVAELGRQYEATGGISFRGFVEQLREDATSTKAEEAPVVEEGSDGVRVMTVHRAKGLEFPVVVLADMTAKLAGFASRYVDATQGLCALKLAGWSPWELEEHREVESDRETSEAVRVAYVAATRARDVLVVPALADEPYREGWLGPLNDALYPPKDRRHDPLPATACPTFGRDGVVDRDGPRPADSVTPGRYVLVDPRGGEAAPAYEVVWWDPATLQLRVPREHGVRGEDLVAKDAPPLVVQESLEAYRAWVASRSAMLARGAVPARVVRTVRQRAADEVARGQEPGRHVSYVDVPRVAGPNGKRRDEAGGARFGALVHAVLASVPLIPAPTRLDELLAVQARVLGATGDEVAEAGATVARVLAHPLMTRAARAEAAGRCRRELPVMFSDAGDVCEGVVDLAFEDGERWIVVDFKTDRSPAASEALYAHQVSLYAEAVARATGRMVEAYIVRV